jgi:hypothetical protein
MDASLRLNPPAHGAFELIAGMATLAAPAVLGFHAAGMIAAGVLGSLLMGMALKLTSPRGRSVSPHRIFDNLFGLLAGVTALLLAFSGDMRATIFFAALVAIHTGLSAVTRYVSAG